MDNEPSPVAAEPMESPIITSSHHSRTATTASMAMAMVGTGGGENDENHSGGVGGSNTANINDIMDGGGNLMAMMGSGSERLALLQEFYQRKHAELLQQLQNQSQAIATAQDYLQSLQLFQSLQQQQQQSQPTQLPTQPHVRPHPHHHPYLANLRQQTSSDQSMDEVEMAGGQPPPTHTTTQPPLSSAQSAGGLRGNRRTLSGSGQTISQTTRDRLKTMIASKKHKQRLHSSCSTGSTSSMVGVGSVGAWKGMGGAGGASTNSEINLPHSAGTMMGTTTSISSAGSKPHFQPYPLPSPVVPHNAAVQTTNVEDVADSELQLRKVNSEPNLKMRIRARLLSKGSSPITVTQHQQRQMLLQQQRLPATAAAMQQFSANCNMQAMNGALAMAQTSDQVPSGALNPLEMLMKAHPAFSAAFQQQQLQQQQVQPTQFIPTSTPTLLQFPLLTTANIMIPSPSLPNLCNGMFASMASGGAGQALISGGAVPTATTAQQPTLDPDAVDATVATCTSSLAQQSSDYTSLMMQASNFATFLSLPSLLRTHALLQPASMLDNPSMFAGADQGGTTEPVGTTAGAGGNAGGATQRTTVRFDSSTRGGPQPPLPIGGYPSLLKQQLRDLVLRRKSLVREEPEEQMSEAQQSSSTAAADALASIAKRLQQKHRKISMDDRNHLKTGLAYESSMAKHQCLCAENNNHVEHGGRVQSIWARLTSSGLASECERVPLKKASLDLLRLVHSPTYVTFFAVSPTACLKLDPSELPLKSFFQLPCGGIGVDSDTYFNDASTQMASRVAIGLLVELVSQVQEGRLSNGFACIRPPGHHAEREQAMGFCFFNNVSIAARHLQQRYQQHCSRIAIIDWDVHHGNGTQLAFESDPHVLYISLHRHDNGNFFPGTGAVTEVGVGDGKGFTVNIPFSGDIMGDAEYLAAWRVLVIPLLDSFKPDFCLVSAGFDATRGHAPALGGYECSPQLFAYFTSSLMSYACGRVVLALEGGYDLPSICDAVEECVKALRGTSRHGSLAVETDRELATGLLPVEALERVPNNAAQDTIQKVIAIHKKHWPCLTGIQGINTSELHWQTISQRFSSLTVEP